MPGTTIKTETVFEYFNSTLDEQKTNLNLNSVCLARCVRYIGFYVSHN